MKLEKLKSIVLFIFVIIIIAIACLSFISFDRKRIKLVVFDMGDTLWTEVKDDRAVYDFNRPFYMIDEDHMFFREGIALQLFKDIKELFSKLYEEHHHNVSICSINDPNAWKWMENGLFDLNIYRFVKHSRIGHQNGDKEIKGKWILEILNDWNMKERLENPIRCDEVLFVDDKIENHVAVRKYCPNIHTTYPPISDPNGMLSILDVI